MTDDMFNGKITHKPNIIKNDSYVIIGSIDHGMQIPRDSMSELIDSLEGTSALMMETPENLHHLLHPMSTELLAKASVDKAPVSYLSGNRMDEDIGEKVLKYAPQDLAEIYIPCMYVRNNIQEGNDISFDNMLNFVATYKQRFGFIDVERTFKNNMKVMQYWKQNDLDRNDLDDFSYDFEKFVGDIREFELWQPELKEFREKNAGKIAVCCGNYHSPFVKSVLEGKERTAPNWDTRIDSRREDELTPQDADFLKKVYENLDKALKSGDLL